MTYTALLSLGSNMGDRLGYLRSAVSYLQKCEISVKAVSCVYQTKAEIIEDQPDFFNAVVGIDTGMNAFALLSVCLGVEQLLGRKRELRYGPRTIDIDLLDFNGTKLITDELVLPHPEFHKRVFVLYPLNDVQPEYILPSGETVSQHIQSLKQEKPSVVAPSDALLN